MKFENYLEGLDFDRLVRLWNEYCWDSGASTDGEIFDSIEELSDNGICTGIELTRAVFFGEVRGWYDKVSFNGYGNLYSVYDMESSSIAVLYLAEWLKDEDHEVYQEWLDEVTSEFSEHLAANVGTTELYKLWVEYEFEGAPASDTEVTDMFDVEILAADLIQDKHQLFQDWLEEQEDEELTERPI